MTSRTSLAQGSKAAVSESSTRTDDESAVKAAVVDFLEALGNSEYERLETTVLPHANVAFVPSSGSGVSPITFEEYISGRDAKGRRKFEEPVREFTVEISQGVLAFVRARATVHYDGKPSHHTDDFFVFIKDDGVWKLFSGSYTVHALEEDAVE